MAVKAIIKKLQTLSQSQMEIADLLISSKPSSQGNNQWSPHQVLQHIASSQAGTIKVMAWKKEKGDFKTIPVSHKFNFILLKLFFKLNFKTKAPSVLLPPNEDVNLTDIKSTLYTQIQVIGTEIECLESHQLNRAIFRHPITGLMNASMTVQFLGLHWKHHRKQILKRMQ
jgi:hypothetical protein